ncbi:hypothetical protein [Streptomyces phaeochromogenes]|uniref:hypothetical protein n=1 Tax=Streptomyces phaeochromogenes TaxID=1923 RepID=UPI00371C3C59
MDAIDYVDEGDTVAVTVRVGKDDVAAQREEGQEADESTAAKAVALRHLAGSLARSTHITATEAEAAADVLLFYYSGHGMSVPLPEPLSADHTSLDSLARVVQLMKSFRGHVEWIPRIPWSELHFVEGSGELFRPLVGHRILLEVTKDGLVPVEDTTDPEDWDTKEAQADREKRAGQHSDPVDGEEFLAQLAADAGISLDEVLTEAGLTRKDI